MHRFILPLLLLSACARTPAQQAAREAERQKLARCGAIEVYPMGVTPPRPYRVVGPVQVTSERNPSSRDRALRSQACGVGADAIIDVRESSTVSAQYVPGSLASPDDTMEATGTAIVYTDVPPPAP